MSNFVLRDGLEADQPFIYTTWLKGLRFGTDVFSWIEQDTYFDRYHKVLEHILGRPEAFIVVACLPDDPSTILGYSVREGRHTLHYVHVKKAFRNFGIGRALTQGDIKTITHLTKTGASIMKEKMPAASFNPFI